MKIRSIILTATLSILAISGIVGLVYVRSQINLYLRKPGTQNWSQVNQFIYQKSFPMTEALVFEPSWLQGYATDQERFKYISILKFDNILSKKTYLPTNLWLIRITPAVKLKQGLGGLGYVYDNTTVIGQVLCDKYTSSKIQTLYSFNSALGDATAWIDTNNLARIDGAWANNLSFGFNGHITDWMNIGIRNVVYSANRARENAIWFHPVADGKKCLEYGSAPLQGKLCLLLGLADSGRSYDKVRTCYFTVFVNNQALERLKIDENNAEQYWEFDLSRFGGKGEVRFEIEPPVDNDVTRRHIFFSAKIITDNTSSGAH